MRHEQLWPIEKSGKKAAGRLLDGRTWDQFPKGV
jgi:protein gp37